MTHDIKLHVQGDYACFTRPEMKAERVSYDVITPSAARGILEAIHWKPEMCWIINRLHVLRPIRFDTIRRNEIGEKISADNVRQAMKLGTVEGLYLATTDDRQQRGSTVLRDVGYVIEARPELTERAGSQDTLEKHVAMFKRRAAKGQCFHRPYLGTREFACDFILVEDDMPSCDLSPEERDRDLGWMLRDIDYANGMKPHFFWVEMRNGIIEVAPTRQRSARS